ncbi:hypothetical protein OSB04_016790 [Centaurea solstitialis]|uniref:CCHC-type domain-containing protein n=1 Tax=Centaurea solstitialis TaxID=347529 RepID=A0AA38TDI8_9ASTR|nr:hypothetical protein OSB04_016790 [Centaurea solstitialis]
MSRDLLSMGSKSKPPVLQIGEYPQWRVRMIQFLNNIDKTLMVSIQEGPIKPYIDIPGTPETATTPAIEPRRVFKLFRHYNELEKIRAELDDKALTLLTMAIPNDLFNRVDSRNTAKELWDELEKQFQGTERSIQAKLNQAIGAYEGFKALEGETLADSYSRFNIILNDLRRNGMQKSTSEINFKFLKNLNPEWDHYSVNLQMNKNLAEEDLHDLYSILSQHEVKVKDIVMKQKSISDSLALLTEKKKSVLPSASSKKKSHSKALVTELSDSDSESLEDESSESDVDLKRVADKLALLSSSIHKRYGKKKFYSKPKFDNYKRDKYKPKDYERRPERKNYEKEKTDEKGNVCFNCGKPGHFVKDCRAPKVRDFDYYSKKAQLAKRKSEGKVLMAEEECWYDDTSDDEDSAHFTQVHYNLMASVEETINLHKQTEETNEARHMWYVDSGCSRHMTGYKELLHNYVERPGGTVSFGNKTTGVIKGYGILTNGKVSIKKVLYVEGLSHNLFSASQFCDGYNIVLFSIINCLIINSDGVEIFEGRRFYNLYVVDFPVIDSSKPVCLFSKATKGESWLWHRRFSHQNFSDISKLANGGLVKGLPKLTFDRDSLCPACQMGKMKRRL